MAPVLSDEVTFGGEVVFVDVALPVWPSAVTPFGSAESTVTVYVSVVLAPGMSVVEVDETLPRLNVPPLAYVVYDGTVPLMTQPVESAVPVAVSVRT